MVILHLFHLGPCSAAAAASSNASQNNMFAPRNLHHDGGGETDANGNPLSNIEQSSICVRALKWVGECLLGCVLSLYRYIRSAPLDFLGAGGSALSSSGARALIRPLSHRSHGGSIMGANLHRSQRN